jgi:hypothetical protein
VKAQPKKPLGVIAAELVFQGKLPLPDQRTKPHEYYNVTYSAGGFLKHAWETLKTALEAIYTRALLLPCGGSSKRFLRTGDPSVTRETAF